MSATAAAARTRGAQDLVREFHSTFGAHIAGHPSIPEPAEQRLRASLIAEEAAEVDEAIAEGDLGHIAKELADLLYVVYGTGLSYGLDLEAALREVHRSNMSKLDENGEVIRRHDGKVLKSALFCPADMSGITRVAPAASPAVA